MEHPRHHPFDVIALVSSAGGLASVITILRGLPRDFPVAVVILQHLSAGTTLVEILAHRSRLPVAWIAQGDRIEPGHVHVCPPGVWLDVSPNGTCALTPNAAGALRKPIDHLLESLAYSYRAGVLAVVLSGMGSDGAAGSRAVKAAGGIVLVESEETAEHSSMPQAVVRAGAADLALPVYEIGPYIIGLVAGGTPT